MKENNLATVYVIQEIPGTKEGRPKINILGAAEYGIFKFLLPELSQIIFSPGPLIFKLRKSLKDFGAKDYLLLTGDPAIIGVACSIVSKPFKSRVSICYSNCSTIVRLNIYRRSIHKFKMRQTHLCHHGRNNFPRYML